jgi:hypothetical protein
MIKSNKLDSTFVFYSIYTNEYVSPKNRDRFDAICSDLLEKHNAILADKEFLKEAGL